MADDDIVDVKVEEEDWDELAEASDSSMSQMKDKAWKQMRVNLQSGQRQSVDLHLIEEVKKHPHMYDLTHAHNRDTFLKEKTWRQIAIAVNAGPEYCKLRWKSIRDRFVKTEKQERRIRASGKKGRTKPYRFAENLAFLRDHLRVKGRGASKEEAQNVSGDIEDEAANQGSVSDKDLAEDDSSISEQGWAPFDGSMQAVATSSPTHHASVGKQLNGQESLRNGNHRRAKRWHGQDEVNDHVLTYLEDASAASRTAMANHQSSGSSQSNTLGYSTPLSHSAPSVDETEASYDEVTYFLMSLAPAMRRLSSQKQSLARIKMQTLLHDLEFNS